MNLVQVVVLLGVLIVGIAIGVLWQMAQSQHQAMQELRSKIEKLEAAAASRLPYHTAEELENAAAAINQILFEADYRKDLAENALAHLLKARANGKKTTGRES